MRWTPEQENAIYKDTGKGNLLVSAAAGSGKTAVLVERVLEKILSGKSRVSRLLIVTFTEAAAAEMRQKIVKRLRGYIKSPQCSEELLSTLKEEIRLTETADIMTIDAFCNRVVQNNFHALGIDPSLRICDEGIKKLMQKEAADNMFKRIYQSGDTEALDRLRRLTDYYAQNRSNDRLAETIIEIHSFIDSFAEPRQWLYNARDAYLLPVEELPAVKYHIEVSKKAAMVALSIINEVRDTLAPDALDFANQLEDISRSIFDAPDWDSVYNIYKDRFSTKKKVAVLEESMEQMVKTPETDKLFYAFVSLYNVFKPYKKDDKVACGVAMPFEKYCAEYDKDALYKEASDLVWLVEEFMDEYEALKEKRGIYEFSDIEHFTYTLFKQNESVRCAYRDKYDEILIDEYQDTNMLQDSIFEKISKNNIFMVGDLKQSIYKFRKGDPYIFKSKNEAYHGDDTSHSAISLSQNFRSRQEILNAVNDIFSKIMTETAGDINYRGAEEIVRCENFEVYTKTTDPYKSELTFLALNKTAKLDTLLCEARFVAKKISELLSSGVMVFDKDTQELRPIKKKDIVILRSSVKGISDYLTEELSRYGIDSYTDAGSFFDRREISIMFSLLSLINNAHQDIPLISVMRSPIGGFTDNELAEIKIHTPKAKYFIDALSEYATSGANERLRAHSINFITKLRRWRGYVRTKSVAELIWTIYEESNFYDIMGAIEEKEDARINLRLLYERARQYEGSGFKGLFNFINYLEKLIDDDDNDISGAKTLGDNHDVVRIMTIHKSKGLEFAYVFLLGTGSDFVTRDKISAVRMHRVLGMGLSTIYYDQHYSKDTYIKELIRITNRNENISERMRLLYVALTRARERLFVVATKQVDENWNEQDAREQWLGMLTGNRMTPTTALNARGFHSWLFPAALASPNTWTVKCHAISEELPLVESQDLATPDYRESKDLGAAVSSLLDYKYPYSRSAGIPSRTSVTRLKEMELERQSDLDTPDYEPKSRNDVDNMAELVFSPLHKTPRFIEGKGTKHANEIGTLYHLVMASLDLEIIKLRGAEAVSEEMARLAESGIISPSDAEYIDTGKITEFFKSSLWERIKNAESIVREAPFQINISAREYDPSLTAEYDGETVILQGIIDCYFIENGEIVLFDYKTDKVTSSEQIRTKYEKQLELYAQAIEKLTGRRVKEKYLYLFSTAEVI